MIEFKPIDILPYIDHSLTVEERNHVNDLILEELMKTNIQALHPSISDIPVSQIQTHAINREISLLEGNVSKLEDNSSEAEKIIEQYTMGGIDISKYNDLIDQISDNFNVENLCISLEYANLHNRALTMQNSNFHENKLIVFNDEINNLNIALENELKRKRDSIEEINAKRYKSQMDYGPVNDYLNSRWVTGIKECIDVGVECARLELGIE